MTKGQFKRQVRQLCGETRGTPAGGNDLLLDDLVYQIVDEICLETDVLYGDFTYSLVAEQDEYCLPRLYKIKAMLILDENEKWQYLRPLSPRQADRNFGMTWRNADSERVPRYGMIGAPSGPIVLSPKPSEDVTDGGRLDGFYAPGKYWSYDSSTGAAEEATDATECPLPVWAHPGVIPGMAYWRCLQFPTPENNARRDAYLAEYERWKGNIAQRAAEFYQKEILGNYPRWALTPF